MQTIADGVQAVFSTCIRPEGPAAIHTRAGQASNSLQNPLLHVKANSVVGKYVVLHVVHENDGGLLCEAHPTFSLTPHEWMWRDVSGLLRVQAQTCQ